MATKYWVGGSGNWSDSTNHWATSSGGAPGVANTPTHLDNVVFDSLSNATAYTMTVDKESFCADITFAAPLVGDMTFAGSASLNVYGNLTLYATLVRTSTSVISFKSTSTGKTITLAGVTMAAQMTFNGVGGGWTLQDAFNIGSGTLLLNAGTLNTNGQTVTCGGFNSSTTNTRTLTLGASVVNCTSFTNTISDNLTLNASTSSIRVTGNGNFAGGGMTFYEVQLNGTAHTVSGSNTYTTLTRTGTATKTDTMTLGANQTVSGVLTLAGNSATNRLFVGSSTKGTAYTLSAGTVTASNVDIQDIIGAGAGSWNLSAITGNSGDCGGNSGITFTTGANQYMKTAASANWSASNWYTTSGGATPGRVPLPQDTAIFDANSITAGSVVITQDMPRIGGVNWTGATNTPTWTTSTDCSVFGSITLISGMTLTGSTNTYTMEGRGSYTITNATKTWAKAFTFNNPSGTYTIQDDFNVGISVAITLTNGTLNTNGQTITCSGFTSNNSNTRTLTLGSSTLNVRGWTLTTTTGLTLNVGTSIIIVTGSGDFSGGGLTYNEVQLNGTSHTITGTNTFTTLTRTGTATKTDRSRITDNITILGVLTLTGNSVTNRLSIESFIKGTQVTITADTVTASNVDIQDMLGAGSASWNLSAITGNSGDCGGNTGITFTTPVTTDWQSGATWSTATWSSRVPLPQDTATFTTAGVATITQDMPRIGSVDFSTSANKTWTTSTSHTNYGSIDLTNLASLGGTALMRFEGRGANTIKSATLTFLNQTIFDTVSGSITFSDDYLNTNASGVSLSSGTLNANNFNFTASTFSTNATATRTLTMGSGTWTLTSTGTVWNCATTTGLTFNANTSTIKLTNSSATSKTIQGGVGLTYNNLWIATGSTGTTTIAGSSTFNDFKIDAGRTVIFTAFTIQTMTTFTAVGTLGNVITLQSSTAGSRAYLKDTSGTNTCDYLSIQDIGVTGGATWDEGANSTFVSGNIGWSGNPAVSRYWVSGGNGYWDSTTNWATSSGGASGASVPIGENVYFDASSGSGEVMIASAPLVNNIDCTGFTGTFIGSSAFTAIYGSMTLVSGMTLLSTGASTFRVNNTSKTLTTGTKTLLGAVTFDIVSDTITPQDAITSNSTLTHTSGTLDFNNLSHSFTTFASTNSNTRTITMGSGTLTLSGTGTVWNMATITRLTLTEGTSTIKVTDASSQTKTFSGGGETFNNIWCTGAGTGPFNFVGSNTFNDFKVDTPPHTISFTAGTTTTVTTFTVSGTVGNLITIGSITSATHSLVKAGGGTVSSDYLSISYSTATPSSTWYAGTHSTDGGNNSGWTFTAPVSLNGSFFAFF